MSNVALGAEIRAARKRLGMTLAALAGALGVSVAFLHDVEHGRRSIKAARWDKLSNVLGVSVDELAALSGKLDDRTSAYIASQPIAMKLVRQLAALNLQEDDLMTLTSKAASLARRGRIER